MNVRARRLGMLSVATATIVMMAGCSPTSSGDDAGAGPIKVGAVSSITGPAPFPDVPAAAEAVFREVNENGGIDGRTIEYLSEDDGGDPALAGQAARRLIDEEGVVALAGSASLVDCSANATVYADRGVVSIAGAGVAPACFTASHIAPVNAGGFEGYTALLYYASEQLEAERVCAVILTVPGVTDGYHDSIRRWEDLTGTSIAMVDESVAHGDDPTPAVLAARSAGCDAVVFNSSEPVAAAFMNSVKRQGQLDEAAWLTLTAAFTDDALTTLQQQDTLGLYVNSEFLPYTGSGPAVDQWRSTLEKAGAEPTSLSMGGYTSAKVLVSVLEGIDSEITRETVTDAFESLDQVDAPLLGTPFTYEGTSEADPDRATMVVQATDDGWETVSDWIHLP
ncbi:ABC transporter substrate-binding protein [Georgenia sp. 10Sc9-8]|uniref:ABC transporter substrate-binding protein n=1 Tax=Georgenia halotolerans TaxID=3028317 RepID=A0ABT5TWT2_9MICO|nr:ABC transporter substrate-binding protein [Georgenia halotolerans]